jgi:hypothetical protein
MTTPSTVQISVALLAVLLSLVPTAKPLTVAQLRRQAAYQGIKGFHRQGKRLPIKYASRRELLAILSQSPT